MFETGTCASWTLQPEFRVLTIGLAPILTGLKRSQNATTIYDSRSDK